MKFGQLIEYNKIGVYNHAENEDILLLFKKALYEVKTSGLLLSLSIFR